MTTIGGYHTTRELHRGGLAVVVLARGSGEAEGPEFVLKVLQFEEGLVEPEGREAICAAFLGAARIHAAAAHHAAGDGGGHWAAVHHIETGPAPFLAAEVFDGSLRRLIDGRIKLDSEQLRLIVGSVLRGLIELRDARARRHGNLKPSNILYRTETRGPEVRLARIVLTDPAPPSPPGANATLAGDLRALGEVLYQLVEHQSFRSRSGWPVPMSPRWRRLGADGEAWLSFCNRLLDPRLAEQRPSLEGLLDELASVSRAGSGAGRRLALIGAAALLACSAGIGAYFLLRDPPPEPVVIDPAVQFDEAAWARLCLAYYNWLGAVVQALGPRNGDAALRERFAADPFLAQIRSAVEGAAGRLNPQVIARSSRDIKTLATQIPDEARTADSVRQMREAIEVLDRIEGLLTADGLTEWELFARAERLAIASGARGWDGASDHLRSLMREIRPSPEFLPAAVAFLDAAPFIAAIDRLERAAARAEQMDDPVLRTLSAAIAITTPAGKRPADLLRDITALDELVRPLTEVLASEWDLIDQELFAQSEAHRALAADPTPRAELFSIWLAEARSARYRLLTEPDPREPEQWRQAGEQVIAGIDRLVEEFELAPAQGPGDFRDRLARIESDIVAVRDLKWNTANRPQVLQASRRIRDDLARLSVDVNNAVRAQVAFANQSLEEVRGQLAAMENIAPSGSDAIDAAWRRERDRLLAGEATVTVLRDRSGALQDVLRSLDAQVPLPLPAGTGAEPSQRARDWSEGLATVAQQERERVLARILAQIDWESGAPAGIEAPASVLDELEAWGADLSRLAADMAAVEDRLDLLYPLAQRTENGEASAEELLDRWSGHEIMALEGVQQALGPLLERTRDLRMLASSADRAVLLAAAEDVGNRARALTAWRRLGDREVGRSVSTGIRGALEDEARLQRLLEGIAGSAPPERRAAIRDELALQRQFRWAAFMNAAASPEDIRAAAAMKGTLWGELGEEAMLQPRALYNLRLHELELSVQEAGLSEDDLKQRIETFRAAAAAISEVADLEPVRLLSAQLGELTSESGPPPVDVTTLGPGDPALEASAWAGELAPDGQRITFRRRIGNADYTLTFVRVEPGAPGGGSGAAPAFLCTEEATLGLFTAVVGERSAWEPVRSFLLTWDLADPRQGPRVWLWTTGRAATVRPMMQSRSWLASNPDLQPDGPHPAYPTVPGGGAFPPPVPTADHPMQYISPSAAVAVARMLGSRLPTTAEWEAALALELGAAPLETYLTQRRPNLRDLTWSLQKQHVDDLVQSRRLGAANSIPPSAGSFWREQPDAFWEGYDDGALWPIPAPPPASSSQSASESGIFQHLIGNVAELVFDAPERLEVLSPAPAAPVDAAAVRAALAADGALGVMGASAQSPPQVDPARRQAFPADSMGHSDVGFRLAFSATGSAGRIEPLVVRLARVLETPSFVPPP